MTNHNDAERLSCLMDGELEHGQSELLALLERDDALRQRWQRYHLISDVMTQHLPAQLDTGFAARVCAAIDEEPTILAPAALRKPAAPLMRQVVGWSVAASVALVALVGVQVAIQNETANPVTLATVSSAPAQQLAAYEDPAQAQLARVEYVERADDPQLNQYLVNHNEYASGMNGMLPYSRIVVSRSH